MPSVPSKTDKGIMFEQRYGTNADLIGIYPCTMQSTILSRNWYDDRNYELSSAAEVLGKGKVIAWLMKHIAWVNELVGPEKVLSVPQITDLATTIYTTYPYLTFSALMAFFQKLKSGEYGVFYGRIDSLQIMTNLRQFIIDMQPLVRKLNQERERKKTEEDCKGGISREEYLKIVERAKNGDEEAKKLLKQE